MAEARQEWFSERGSRASYAVRAIARKCAIHKVEGRGRRRLAPARCRRAGLRAVRGLKAWSFLQVASYAHARTRRITRTRACRYPERSLSGPCHAAVFSCQAPDNLPPLTHACLPRSLRSTTCTQELHRTRAGTAVTRTAPSQNLPGRKQCNGVARSRIRESGRRQRLLGPQGPQTATGAETSPRIVARSLFFCR
jgi:hypothetical protein